MPTPLPRQHFEAIAAVIHAHSERVGYATAYALADNMASAIGVFNRGFRRDAFVDACLGGDYRNKSRSTRAVRDALTAPETMSADGATLP